MFLQLTKFNKISKMNKNYKLLVPFFAVALFLLAGLASAAATVTSVEFDGIDVSDASVNYVEISTGSSVPVMVLLSTDAAYDEIKIKVELEDETETETIYDIGNGSTRRVTLNLDMPSELDELDASTELEVTIYGYVDGDQVYSDTTSYQIRVQRESYEVSVLSADYTTKVDAGDIVPVTVVLKNTGYRDLDDTYVIVSIPALGISTRAYVDDLYSVDETANSDDDDSAEKTVFLQIPTNAETGVYELVVEAYNDDTETVQKSVIAVEGVTSSDDSKTLSQDDNGNSNSIIALTIVLAVVFVALLVVLIVLITKKDKTFEEVETSYY